MRARFSAGVGSHLGIVNFSHRFFVLVVAQSIKATSLPRLLRRLPLPGEVFQEVYSTGRGESFETQVYINQ
jgi:hypothetical protein